MLNKNAKAIWLASYPKSGNTWTSLFLSVLIKNKTLDINVPGIETIISARNIIDETLGMYSSGLPEKDYVQFRSVLYEKWLNRFTGKDYLLLKVHDGCVFESNVLFPPSITRASIYILRNPFDMAASLANHSRISINEAVKSICSNTYKLAVNINNLNNQTSQHLGTWSQHIESWTNVHRNNILLLKYEDMVKDSVKEFSKIIDYLELSYTKEEIERAVETTRFENLKEQEKQTKFKATPNINSFFRSGKVGGWRTELTKEQINLIIDCNYEALLKYDYIDKQGNILV